MKKILFIFALLSLMSCGGTTVKVKQSSDGVNATISVQTNNPTNVEVQPSIEVNLDDLNDILDAVQDSVSFDENGEIILTGTELVKLAKNFR